MILDVRHAPVLIAHSYYLRYDAKQLARMRPYPPLATLLAAAFARSRGLPVAFFDAMLSTGVGAFVERLDEVRPSVVGLIEDNFNFLTKMCTVRMRTAACDMIRAAKARGCRIAISGSDATDRPEPYFAAGADAIMLGDPEHAIATLAERWQSDATAPVTDVPGLLLPGHGAPPHRTTARALLDDLDTLPLPAWDLVDVEAYRSAWREAHGRFSWNVVASRGCPYGCNWCAKPIFGTRYAQRRPAHVADEVARLAVTVQPDHLWFADDIFGLTPRWLLAFAAALRQRNVRIPFMMQSRVNLMTPAVVAALADAGAEEVWLGVESGAQHILDTMHKGSTVAQARRATQTLRAHGIRAGWFIQLGYPNETWPDIVATRDLVRDERPDDIGVSVAYPLPGTAFYDNVRQQLAAKQNWDDSGELAMMFAGTYDTPFYHAVRDLLHREVDVPAAEPSPALDDRWAALGAREAAARADGKAAVR